MSRPLRIEFPGALYHVTSRGDRREPIYRDDADRLAHLDVLAHALSRFDAQVVAYCLMGNHYHLVLHTSQPNLSRLMRQLNGVYTQHFNRRHGLVGHLFQGRFKAILVEAEQYLLALCRYVERNPVAAGLVRDARDWPWSSCRAHLALAPAPEWLETEGLYVQLLARPCLNASDRRRAAKLYAELIDQGRADSEASFWADNLRQQVFLGGDGFVERMQGHISPQQQAAKSIPRAQRSRALTWPACLSQCEGDRVKALYMAYTQGAMTMTALAEQSGLSVSHVSRLIRRAEEGKGET